jgi:Circularly permutated YpsA SLOG family
MDLPHGFTIVSGGQTGADRAALDFAIRQGIPHDGWCPRGRLAEDGPLDDCYRLRQTPTSKYEERTRWNVRDTDATLVVTIRAKPSGGTALTLGSARQQRKPCLHIARETIVSIEAAAGEIAEFITEYGVERLNVAGPRASQEPEIAEFVHELLTNAFVVSGSISDR